MMCPAAEGNSRSACRPLHGFAIVELLVVTLRKQRIQRIVQLRK
jgi:hypothetical protein